MRRLLPDLLLLALEVVLVAAWLRWIGRVGGGGAPAPVASVVAALGGYVLVRGMLRAGAADGFVRVAIMAGAWMTVLGAARWWLFPGGSAGLARSWPLQMVVDLVSGTGFVSGAALLVVGVLLPWWRGARLAGGYPYPGRARSGATRALWSMAVLLCLHGLAGGRVDFSPGPWIAIAAVLALLALAATRLRLLALGDDEAGAESGASVRLSGMLGMWSGTALAAVVGVAGTAVAVGALAAGAAPVLLAPLRAVGVGLRYVLVAVLARLALVIFFFVEGIYALLGALAEPDDERLAGERPVEALAERLARVEPFVWPPWLERAWQWLFAGLLLLIVLVWLWHGLRARRQFAPSDTALEERRSALSAARVGRDLVEGLRALRDAALAAVTGSLDWRARGVRRMYARLLRHLAASGAARAPDQTPREFRPLAAQALPGHDEDLAALTAAYEGARYGEREPDAPTWSALRQAWRRMRAVSGGGGGDGDGGGGAS